MSSKFGVNIACANMPYPSCRQGFFFKSYRGITEIPSHFYQKVRSDVETKKLNRFCKIAIGTQFEKGI